MLEQDAQRSGCPIPGNAQDQDGRGFEQTVLVGGAPADSREVHDFKGSFQAKPFYDSRCSARFMGQFIVLKG